MGNKIIQMRDVFLNKLYELAQQDKNIILITDDLDATAVQSFKTHLPKQIINIGIAEQNMINIAAGLALKGKKVYVYAIAPFATLRCLEQIKVNLCLMNLPVTILGTGAGMSYNIAGPTHHATEDIAVMNALPRMTIYNPSDNVMVEALVDITYNDPGPKYIRFDRIIVPNLYSTSFSDFSSGVNKYKTGLQTIIITSGTMVHTALDVCQNLSTSYKMHVGVIDLYRIKPVNEKQLLNFIENTKSIVTIEEHQINGGIGSIIAGILTDNNIQKPLKRIGIQDKYCTNFGTREFMQQINNLDTESIIQQILDWHSKITEKL